MTQPEFDEQQFLVGVFSDIPVKAAIKKTNWFTIKKIRRIVEKTEVPTRIGLFGPYKNPELAACLEAAEPPFSKEYAVFLQLYLFLKENMISPQGHAFASTFYTLFIRSTGF